MTAQIIRLYPRTMAEHGPLRTVEEVIKQKLRAGVTTPGGAIAALVVYKGMNRDDATAAVDTMMRELANG